MDIAYADPPYPGLARYYAKHADYAGEVNHSRLLRELSTYDGWVLHTSVPALAEVLRIADGLELTYRVCSWVKPWASFKPSQALAYAWEPVLVHAARRQVLTGFHVMRDWMAEPMTMQRGLTGAKPERVCHWLFECVGAQPDDTFHDLFPGTGAVSRAWTSWGMLLREPEPPEPHPALFEAGDETEETECSSA